MGMLCRIFFKTRANALRPLAAFHALHANAKFAIADASILRYPFGFEVISIFEF